MVTQPAHAAAFVAEDPVLDAAATVWVVLQNAQELPATPEGRARLARGRERLRELMATAGISEEDIVEHVERQRSPLGCREHPPDDMPAVATLRLLQGGND